ncbi:PREDICTED: uncharacterized protein LOC107353187 [Acropora digitifera]|uniref:uncharacterized protein LOC107353187 n=1 Tax=Acropora digitifera TaxID=70779 RepID=UPI00077A78C6|nr:PREDICTED: uncharacterized protein LOC107353187 [Acropora digitifera]
MGQDSSKQGIGNEVLEQSEETKLQCVVKTSNDTSSVNGGSEVDAAEVQEKVKEVICKTITSIPLTDATSRERLNSDENSTKDKLDSPSSVSCAGEEGKLLVKGLF